MADKRWAKRTQGIPRWSPSKLNCFQQCGERFRRRYVLGERGSGPSIPAAIGRGVHAAAEHDNRAKQLLGESMLLPELAECAVTEYEATIQEGVEASPHDIGRGKDTAADAAILYGQAISPTIARPVICEEPIVAGIGDIELAGITDYADEQAVYDLKFGRKVQADWVARCNQLSCYGLIYRARTGRYPERLAIDNIHNGKRGLEHTRIWTTRTEGDYRAFFERVRLAQQSVEAGVFMPAGEYESSCNPRWCEFWNSCPFVTPARRAYWEANR